MHGVAAPELRDACGDDGAALAQRMVLYGSAPSTVAKRAAARAHDGKAPDGTRALILAVDVERSGPDAVAHATIAIGAALVAWGVVPHTRTAFHKLLHRGRWGSLKAGTRFDACTWASFWSHQDDAVLRGFVNDDAATEAYGRDCAVAFLMSVAHSMAHALRVPLHIVSDNPGYDVPHVDAWLRAAPCVQRIVHECSTAPVLPVTAGGVPCGAQQFKMVHGLNYDANDRWRRVKCLRSLQEGILTAHQRTQSLHTTRHSDALREVYNLPHDDHVVQRNSHDPAVDAHVCAVDYAHILSIRTGHAAVRTTTDAVQ